MMGTQSSKMVTDTKNDIVLAEINLPAPTVSTPQPIKSIDPRSPTADIARTPIETISHFPTECCLETQNNDLFDAEIHRTPVTIKPNNFKLDKDIRRKLLKDSAMKIISKTDQITAICDRIIESNTTEIHSDTSLSDLSPPSRVGLLETNMDFIETDVDQVYKKHSKCITPRDILNAKLKRQVAGQDSNILELIDPRSPTVGIDRTPVQVIKPLDIDPRSPSIDFERTPIQIPIETCDKPKDFVMNIENFEQRLDSLCVTDSEDEKVPEATEKVPEKTMEKKMMVKRNLIYEDADCVTPTRKVQNKQNEGSGRTPLGIRNGNGAHCRSKSANGRLHQQDSNKIDLKSEYAVSKIPVFNKNVKKIRGKIQQCENTPPSSLVDMKLVKRTQWDSADNTMII